MPLFSAYPNSTENQGTIKKYIDIMLIIAKLKVTIPRLHRKHTVYFILNLEFSLPTQPIMESMMSKTGQVMELHRTRFTIGFWTYASKFSFAWYMAFPPFCMFQSSLLCSMRT